MKIMFAKYYDRLTQLFCFFSVCRLKFSTQKGIFPFKPNVTETYFLKKFRSFAECIQISKSKINLHQIKTNFFDHWNQILMHFSWTVIRLLLQSVIRWRLTVSVYLLTFWTRNPNLESFLNQSCQSCCDCVHDQRSFST